MSDTWFTVSPRWTSTPDDHKSELLSIRNTSVSDVTLRKIMENSSKFPREFPIETVRCHQLLQIKIPQEVLEKNVNSASPVIHEYALYLCSVFLTHQKKWGNREFYQNMSLLDLIDRLLSKRAVSFTDPLDNYMLLDGSEGVDGWEQVGTPGEMPPLILQNCLSYDEIKLSALLSVSSHTVFINSGHRFNIGIFENDRKKIENDGVIMGLIGPRLHRPCVMEYREIMKTPEQNNHRYGFGNFLVPTLQSKFSSFYGDISAHYDNVVAEMQSNDRYVELMDGHYFDKLVYSRRISLSIDTLLIEANDRAKTLNKMAYVHVVGLGLGVWRIYEGQDRLFMDTFAARLILLSDVLTNISDICFAYIDHKMAAGYKHGDHLGKIKLHMVNKEEPHTKLAGEDEGKLLVVSYAWDGNALPGNEFWWGYLSNSSDSAAASSTQVTELHNWHINEKVSARNLKVATLQGLVTFQEYQELHKYD